MATAAGNGNERNTIVIAILTTQDEANGFRGNRDNFVDLIRTGNELGVTVYVVTAKDLILTGNSVFAFKYNDKLNTWEQQWLPLPNVVYNRIPNREEEMIPDVQKKIAECLKHPRIRLFNPAFFNKWHLHEWLKETKRTRGFIPTTYQLKTRPELRTLLKRHSRLYLKPESGKAGSGIMRVEHRPNRPHYRLNIQEERGSHQYNYVKIQSLWKKILQCTGDEQYIVQQGIRLASTDNRPFDLRVLAQKDRKGRWRISGIGARVAGSLSITTHVPRGGSIDNPVKLLENAFGSVAGKHILRKAHRAALTIAKQIEKGSGNKHGEMSLDLGIDASGKVWFFEANAKPMKFDEPLIRKRSLHRLIHYCIYLSKRRESNENHSF